MECTLLKNTYQVDLNTDAKLPKIKFNDKFLFIVVELWRECICQAHLGSPTFTLFRAKLIEVLNSLEILQYMRYEIENDKIATNGGLQQ